MTGTMTLDVKGLLPLKRQLQLLAMTKPKRRRLLSKMARKVVSDSKKRVRTQTDLNGRPFDARAKKRSRKMLSRLVKQLRVTRNDGLEAVVGFYNPVVGKIASKQQHGFVEHINVAALNKTQKQNTKSPATRRQAIALREAGFQIKAANGKRLKTPTLKWVQANMKVGQAGVALRYLREKAGEKIKTSWATVLPARSFLGASHADVTNHIDTLFKQMTQEIAHGAR